MNIEHLHPQRPRRAWWMSTLGLMKAVLGLGCALGLFLTVWSGLTPRSSNRSLCVNRLKQIMLALSDYHEVYAAFPPAYVVDASRRPMHSWRVLLLPFLEQQGLYAQYDFREPWDGPNNSKLLNRMPDIYGCPSRRHGQTSLACYAAITGPGTVFPSEETIDLACITDGSSKTVMIAEVANVDIPWTAPVDLDFATMTFRVNDPKRPSPSSCHPGGANVGVADGLVHFLREDISSESLRALFTRAGGEKGNVLYGH